MIAILGYTVFAAAMAVAVGVISATVLPAWTRIVSLLSGNGDPAWSVEPKLAVVPRRHDIRVRRTPDLTVRPLPPVCVNA